MASFAAEGEGEETDDEQLQDLLACLGEEEQKVERLKQKLEELGVDPKSLLDGLGGDDSAVEEQGQPHDFT